MAKEAEVASLRVRRAVALGACQVHEGGLKLGWITASLRLNLALESNVEMNKAHSMRGQKDRPFKLGESLLL